jgi:hypothetical protein
MNPAPIQNEYTREKRPGPAGAGVSDDMKRTCFAYKEERFDMRAHSSILGIKHIRSLSKKRSQLHQPVGVEHIGHTSDLCRKTKLTTPRNDFRAALDARILEKSAISLLMLSLRLLECCF